jgi:hypothetical protein
MLFQGEIVMREVAKNFLLAIALTTVLLSGCSGVPDDADVGSDGASSDQEEVQGVEQALTSGPAHVVAGFTNGAPGFGSARPYHALRNADGSWTNFGSIELQAGDVGDISDVATASNEVGDLYVVVNSYGTSTKPPGLYLTIRQASNGTWSAWTRVDDVSGGLPLGNNVIGDFGIAVTGNYFHLIVTGIQTVGSPHRLMSNARNLWTGVWGGWRWYDDSKIAELCVTAVGTAVHVLGFTWQGDGKKVLHKQYSADGASIIHYPGVTYGYNYGALNTVGCFGTSDTLHAAIGIRIGGADRVVYRTNASSGGQYIWSPDQIAPTSGDVKEVGLAPGANGSMHMVSADSAYRLRHAFKPAGGEWTSLNDTSWVGGPRGSNALSVTVR